MSIKYKELRNNRPMGMGNLLPRSINGMQLLNANGDIDPASAGFNYVIGTLSYIRSKIAVQKFYEIAIADYMPVDVGEAAWSEEIVQNLVLLNGGDFFQGDINNGAGAGKIANVGTSLSPLKMPVKSWAKGANWTIFELAQAAAAGNWDKAESDLMSLKKNWDLGIQEVAFLGHPADTLVTGLLNDAAVNSNTTLITKLISTMSSAEFSTFVAGLLAAYWANSQATVVPDTFIIPTNDYLGLAVPVNTTSSITMLEYLLNVLKVMTANPNFKILPLAYAQATYNTARGINKQRYVLYRRVPETLTMNIPVDLTILNPASTNNINWQQPAYGQYSGCMIARKREVLYFDF